MRILSLSLLVCLFLGIGSISCQSVHNRERIEDLQERMEALSGSEHYLSDGVKEEFTEIREELVDALLDEGKTEMSLIGRPGHNDARQNAIYFFELVKEISNDSFSFTAQEFNQKWTWMKEWAWKDGFNYTRGDWNICKIAIPVLWPWTIGESLFCTVSDLIGHWETDTETITLPVLSATYAVQAQEHLDRLKGLSTEALQAEAASMTNIRVEMTYKLTGTPSEISVFEMTVDRGDRLPGVTDALISSQRYQDIWDTLARELRNTRFGSERAYLTAPNITITSVSSDREIDIRVTATGFVPYEKLNQVIRTISFNEEGREDDLEINLYPYDPEDSR